MKTLSIILLILTIFAAAAFGQETNKPATIEVVGTADIMVEPDEVVFSIDVTKRNMDLQIAKSETDSALAKVLAVTRKFEIKPQDVSTNRISIEMKYETVRDPKKPVYDEDGDLIGTRTFVGYEASTNVNVKLNDIKKFENFFNEVLLTGVSEVNSVSFQSSKMIDYVKEARIAAMKAAYDKATAMAGAIGQTIGKAIFIKEGSDGGTGFNINGRSGSSNSFSVANFTQIATTSKSLASFSPGAIRISSQVSVTFLLN